MAVRKDFLQSGYGVRFEWGQAGARHLAREVSCLVVVDVLSFTTSVPVAVEAGARVFPYPWRADQATACTEQKDARPALEGLLTAGAAVAPLNRPRQRSYALLTRGRHERRLRTRERLGPGTGRRRFPRGRGDRNRGG